MLVFTSQKLKLVLRGNKWDFTTTSEIKKLLARGVIQHLTLPLGLDEFVTSEVLGHIAIERVKVGHGLNIFSVLMRKVGLY